MVNGCVPATILGSELSPTLNPVKDCNSTSVITRPFLWVVRALHAQLARMHWKPIACMQVHIAHSSFFDAGMCMEE